MKKYSSRQQEYIEILKILSKFVIVNINREIINFKKLFKFIFKGF